MPATVEAQIITAEDLGLDPTLFARAAGYTAMTVIETFDPAALPDDVREKLPEDDAPDTNVVDFNSGLSKYIPKG